MSEYYRQDYMPLDHLPHKDDAYLLLKSSLFV